MKIAVLYTKRPGYQGFCMANRRCNLNYKSTPCLNKKTKKTGRLIL